MFYKNTEHYKNTLQKIIREEFDYKVNFVSDKAMDFLHLCWMTSDRDKELDAGYDLMCCIRHHCHTREEVSFILKKCISTVRYCDMDTEVDFDIYMKKGFSDFGYNPEKEVL